MEEVNSFVRRSKKYRTKYMDELRNLYAIAQDEAEVMRTERVRGPDKASGLVTEQGDKIYR